MPSLKPIELTPIVQRIMDNCPAYLFVAKAANRAAVMQSHDHAMPAAFVIEPTYSAKGVANTSGGVVTQPHNYEVGVVTVIRNYADAQGALQSEEAETVRGQLWEAMLTYRPEGQFAFDLGQGGLLTFDDQVFMYLDTFRLIRRVRN